MGEYARSRCASNVEMLEDADRMMTKIDKMFSPGLQRMCCQVS
jgi:hypothetical protein